MGAATAEGRFELLPLTAFYPWQGQDVVVDRALDEGSRRCGCLRVAAALTVLTPQAYRDIEQNMDRLCRTPGVGAMPVRALDDRGAGVGRGRCDASAWGARADVRQHGEPGGAGAARGDRRRQRRRARRSSAPRWPPLSSGRDELRLDLARLGFLDVAACRAIADTSRAFRATGRRLLLVGPPRPWPR